MDGFAKGAGTAWFAKPVVQGPCRFPAGVLHNQLAEKRDQRILLFRNAGPPCLLAGKLLAAARSDDELDTSNSDPVQPWLTARRGATLLSSSATSRP